jgi:DNA polymerase-3 subunit delta
MTTNDHPAFEHEALRTEQRELDERLRVARLDGAGVSNERDAAAVLGIKGSTFPARKALNVAKALGPKGSRRAVALLAEADLTLRGGGTAWPGELVLEVLVARLSRLGGSRRR